MRLLFLLAALAACSSGTSKPPAAPQPPESKAAARPAASTSADPSQGAETRPAMPTGPAEMKISPAQTTVKLVSDGQGTKQVLRYSARPGARQTVEVAMDFTGRQDTEEATAPTIVLTCDARTGAVDKNGAADYTLTVTGADARPVAGSDRTPQDLKPALAGLTGLTIAGKRSANGAIGETTLRLAHPPASSDDALGLIRETLPVLPVLPTQPVGVGAKWQSTTAARLADKFDITQVTDYEVVAHDGASWTIKGTTKVSGKDQKIDNAMISAISGSGTSETTIADGAVYPAHKEQLETTFKASDPESADPGKAVQFTIKVGGTVTPK
ncbi:MAG TPA: DUF6263 family protein [Kofleriaceae bacterium]